MSMQVTCPHCGARYQFERSLIPPGGYDAQCANCSGIFPVAPSPVEELAIALPSMSMVDTWLTAPPIAPKKRAKETPPTAQSVAISAVEPVAPEKPAAPPVQAAVPANAPHTAAHVGSLDYTIACAQCATVYALSVEDIPIGGLNATCPKCSTQYRLTSVGILSVPADLLRPISPPILLEDRVTIDAPRGALGGLANSVKPRPNAPGISDFEASVSAAVAARQEPSFGGPSAIDDSNEPGGDHGPVLPPVLPPVASSVSKDDVTPPRGTLPPIVPSTPSFAEAPTWTGAGDDPALAAASEPSWESGPDASFTAPAWTAPTPPEGQLSPFDPSDSEDVPAWGGAPVSETPIAAAPTWGATPPAGTPAAAPAWGSTPPAGTPAEAPAWSPAPAVSPPAAAPPWSQTPQVATPSLPPISAAPRSPAAGSTPALQFQVPGGNKSPIREMSPTHARETPFSHDNTPPMAQRAPDPSPPVKPAPVAQAAAPAAWNGPSSGAPAAWNGPSQGAPAPWNGPSVTGEPELPPMVVAEPMPSQPERLHDLGAKADGAPEFGNLVTAEHHYGNAPRGLDGPSLGDLPPMPASADGRSGPLSGGDFSDESIIPPLQNVRVPAATNERSRAGAANWGPNDSLPPGVKMRAKDPKRKRRPPFDDDDAAHWRGGGSGKNVQIRDAREFDDTDESIRRAVRSPRKRFAVTLLAVAAVSALLWFGIPWIRGNGLQDLLGLEHREDARVTELLQAARLAMLDDTDAAYKTAAEGSSEALDIDPASNNARIVYGLATAFRGADLRASARELAASGEVVQSSQMLSRASEEMAHARRVLARRNDTSAELAFAAGLYYAIEDGQIAQARELFIKGMGKMSLASSEVPPTAHAALLSALLKRNEGDADGTRVALLRALQLEPTWQRPRYELARELAAHNDPNGARRVLGDVLTAVPAHVKSKTMLTQVDEVVNAPVGNNPAPVAPAPVAPAPVTPAPAPGVPAPQGAAPAPGPDVKSRLEQLRNEMAPEPEIGTPPDQKAMVRGAAPAPAPVPAAPPEAPKADDAPAPEGQGETH